MCHLALGLTIDVVAIYAVDDGRITNACHYFSDPAMLVRVGILSASDFDNAPTGDQRMSGARRKRNRPWTQPARVSSRSTIASGEGRWSAPSGRG